MPQTSIAYYVAPDGQDRWSGRLPAPNTQRSDGPFATLERARDAIRALKRSAGLSSPVTVSLRGGRYPLTRPIEFGPQDSAPVTYAPYPGEQPVLDSGLRIRDWQVTDVHGHTAWMAEMPELVLGQRTCRSLFVNGERRYRPRWPKEGMFQIENVPGRTVTAQLFEGSDTFQYAAGDIRAWRNLTDVEVIVPHYWTSERMPIWSLGEATRTLRSSRRSVFSLTDDFTRKWAHYYVENVFEALSPGEWYLDRPEGKLYYLPLPGESPETAEVVAPRTEQFIRLIGRPEQGEYVEFLRFEGLSLAYGDWSQPGGGGEGFTGEAPATDLASAPQAACNIGGVIELRAARYCAIENCRIEHVGIYGIDMKEACVGNRLVGNEIADMGAGGVKLTGADAGGPSALRSGQNRITDNHIHHGGRVFHAAVGIITCHAFGNTIAHNHIHHLLYSGISCGWNWGYMDSVSKDNRIEKNHIHHLGDGVSLNDMGCIYTLGVQPGTVIRGNLCHDVSAKNYGGWGIYLDEGSSHILVENNISYDTSSQAFHQHYGRENVIRNNIFAFGRQSQIALSRVEDHNAFTLEKNIIVTNGVPLSSGGYAGTPPRRRFRGDLNLLWDAGGQPITSRSGAQALNLAQVQELGEERHSIVADPGFADLTGRNFALTADSPARVLGFEPIDLSDAGPRPPEARE